MITIDSTNTNNQVTVPIVYSGGTRWEFKHDFSGEIYDLIGPTNQSTSPLHWKINLNGQSFPYTGLYTLRIYKLTGESIWTGNMNVTRPYSVTEFDQQNERDNVIFD